MDAIKSLLDNDLYKFTMMQAVWEKQPEAVVSYQFINRRESDTFSEQSVELIRQRIQELCRLRLSEEELNFLVQLPFIKPSFVEFLRTFQLKESDVTIKLEDGKLQLHVDGTWVNTILWEVPLMAIISQTYFEIEDQNWNYDLDDYYTRTLKKGQQLTEAGCKYIDFGTRRRRSFDTQDTVVRAFSDESVACMGSSNVYLAMKYGMQPVGTMAHEWIMGYAGLNSIANANRIALEAWREVYGDQLGVALTDTYTTELFFKDISGELAKSYAALRHDSECPIVFADRVLDFYEKEGIDPKTKGIVFSDSLSVGRAIEIERYIDGRTNPSYGIGTHFTNDFEGSKALNIVIKLYSINGVNVAKISDNPGKASGAKDAIEDALAVINESVAE